MLLSSPALVAAVPIRYISVATSLSLLSLLELSFVEPVIEFDRELNYLIELVRSVDPYKFVLDILLESPLKEPDIGIIVKVEMRDNLLEFGGVYASRSGLSQSIETSFSGSGGVNVSKGLFKLLLEDRIRHEDFLSDISLVLLRFVVEFSDIGLKPFEYLSA